MVGDLHCHSVCSDGFNTTAQVADFAARAHMDVIALSDHDTMLGVRRITDEAAALGVQVIPACECTCRDFARGRAVHMLCYAPKYPEQLQAFLNPSLESRRLAKLAMTDLLAERYPITRADVLAASAQCASIYEVHLIAPLAAMGYSPTVCGELFKQTVAKGGSCHVDATYPDARDVAKQIREVGGMAVIAHPGQFDSLALAEELAQQGLLGGVECRHPRNSAQVEADAAALCERFGLIQTGGSDFHGMYASKPHPIGACVTDAANLERVLAFARH